MRVVRSSLVALVATVGALGFAAPSAVAAPACADVDLPPSAIGVERSVTAIGCLVDHERTVAGLGTLAVEPHVRTAAQRFAEDMVSRGFFSHESPDGTDPGARLRAAGFGWSAFGENIASGQQTPREVMTAWLASEGHCENLMTPMFTVAGYGIATAWDGPYWVQDFGRPLTSGVTVSSVAPPSCPRAPAPDDAVAPSASTQAAASATSTAMSAPVVRRSGRRLRVRLALPAGDGTLSVVVRVTQAGRTVRRAVLRRPAGSAQAMTVRLRTARGGRVVARVGEGQPVAVSFR